MYQVQRKELCLCDAQVLGRLVALWWLQAQHDVGGTGSNAAYAKRIVRCYRLGGGLERGKRQRIREERA